MNQNKTIAVLGAGTMGAGIAMQYAAYGHKVVLYSRTEATLERARKTIEKSCQLYAENQLVPEADALNAKNMVSYTTSVQEAVKDAWYVVETVAERANIKTELYKQLDDILPEDVIISSNTSYMNIFEFLADRRQPYTTIVHWFAPAHILPLVEIIKGPQTEQSTVDKMVEFHKSCGKTPICMDRYVPGFIINRLQGAMNREIIYLLENNFCSAEAIDLAVKSSLMPRGLAVGVVEKYDFTGMDMASNGIINRTYTPAPAPTDDNILTTMAKSGKLGVKSGEGFYDYSHKPYEEVLADRDAQLLESVRLANKFMENPLYNTNKK